MFHSLWLFGDLWLWKYVYLYLGHFVVLIDTVEWSPHPQQTEIPLHKSISTSNTGPVGPSEPRVEGMESQQRQVSPENDVGSHGIKGSSNSHMEVPSAKILEKPKDQRYLAGPETADPFEHDDGVRDSVGISNEISKRSFPTPEIMDEHCGTETLDNNSHAHNIPRIWSRDSLNVSQHVDSGH